MHFLEKTNSGLRPVQPGADSGRRAGTPDQHRNGHCGPAHAQPGPGVPRGGNLPPGVGGGGVLFREHSDGGKRFCDKFINKNANRAAACIAMKYGLEAPPKAVEREKAHQEAEGRRKKEKSKRLHKPSASQSEIDEKMRRKRAVEEAAKRKSMLKYVIEKAAKKTASTEAFIAALAEEGITLTRDEKKGICAVMTDPGGKVRKYSIAKDLGVNMTLIPNLSIQDKPVVKTQHSSPLKPLHHARLNVDGSGSSRNAEHEINDGRNSDDSDEEWKRRNGYKL